MLRIFFSNKIKGSIHSTFDRILSNAACAVRLACIQVKVVLDKLKTFLTTYINMYKLALATYKMIYAHTLGCTW